MSSDARGVATEIDTASEFDDKLNILDEAIAEVEYKITTGRIRDVEKERVRQGWYRVLKDLIKEWRECKEAATMEELQEEVAQLKERQRVTV